MPKFIISLGKFLKNKIPIKIYLYIKKIYIKSYFYKLYNY
ncbi:MAG: hypothetical protein QG630_437, partial [Patescibacteria group bacterium]|nr:hypothetical protein [Patescibacteria group bacterium]